MHKKQEGIFGSIRMNKEKYINAFLDLYNQGFNDSEIARYLQVNNVTISTWRNQRNLEKNFKYSHKFNENLFMKYYNEGLNWKQIADKLNISDSAAQAYGSAKGLKTHYLEYEKTELSDTEFQVFLGTIYGDAYIRIPDDSKNASGHFAHSLKQKEYCKWKYSQLSRFCSEPKEVSEIDKRSGKEYYAIDVKIKANPVFTELYPYIYNNKIKYINSELINKIEPLGIAVWFMDDGYYDHESYGIATNCFMEQDLNLIVKMFKSKFDLNFTIHSNHTIRLIKKDAKKFYNLVFPYIHTDCLYKLGPDALKTPLNRETPTMDNPVLNPQEIEENAERLEVTPNEKDEAIKSSTKAGHCSE